MTEIMTSTPGEPSAPVAEPAYLYPSYPARVASSAVEGGVLRHAAQPRERLVGDAVARPAGQGPRVGLLHHVLGRREAPQHADQRREQRAVVLSVQRGDAGLDRGRGHAETVAERVGSRLA